MLRRLHSRLGTAGFVISIVALVVALGGGAYAASGGLTGKQKKEVEKIAKKYAGKPGTNGAPGAPGAKGDAGAKGDTGATGAAGKDGANGTNGTSGTNGAAGKSVEAFEVSAGETACAGNGGVEYEIEESGEATEVCNGSPWTVGSLPAGKTEMGAWSVGPAATTGFQYAPLSFSVPLAVGATVSVHYVNGSGNEEEEGEVVAEPATTCLGTNTNPSAPPGTLCVYESATTSTFLELVSPQGRAGAILEFKATAVGANARGSWAVTAPS
jgi:collagen type I/II/III/V/XI/XXIV/XXVII alpha